MTLTGRHLRMARAALNWSQEEIASQAKVSSGTIKRMEIGNGPVPARMDTLARIVAAYEKSGIEFLDSEHPGVRFHSLRSKNRSQR